MAEENDAMKNLRQMSQLSPNPMSSLKNMAKSKGKKKERNKKIKPRITRYSTDNLGRRLYPFSGRYNQRKQRSVIAPAVNTDEGRGHHYYGEDNDMSENAFVENEYEETLTTAMSLLPKKIKKKRNWSDRTASSEANWQENRKRLFDAVLKSSVLEGKCMKCDSQAIIKCINCGHTRLCHSCDRDLHSHLPLHNRLSFVNGFCQPLPPNEFISENHDFIEIEQFVPLLPGECYCGSRSFKKVSTNKTTIVVTLSGRFELLQYVDVCVGCGNQTDPVYLEHVIRSGFWPHSPSNFNVLFQIEVFSVWDQWRKQMPGSSEQAFLESLNYFTEVNGRNGNVNPTSFSYAFKNWCFMNYEMEQVEKKNWMKCPSCSIRQHSCHIDGNCKLYRYRSSGRRGRESYYNGAFIQPDENVDTFLKDINISSRRKEVKDTFCGGDWTAARNKALRKGSLDSTGLELVACRHQFGQHALNMKRGELFAYACFLVKNCVLQKPVNFIYADVICKLWGYMVRLDPSIAQKAQGALSVMHAKGHSLDCQLKWDGEWIKGTGRSTGEECEQIFSYLSRCSNTTKYQKPENREETLTELIMFWNKRKTHKLAHSLKTKFQRVSKDLVVHQETLKGICRRLDVSESSVDFDSMLKELQSSVSGGNHFDTSISWSQAAILLKVDLRAEIPSFVPLNIRSALLKFEVPDLSGIEIPILKKTKAQKERLLQDSWSVLNLATIKEEFSKLTENVLVPVFRKAMERTYFELIHWKTRMMKIADTSKQRFILRRKMSDTRTKLVSLSDRYKILTKEVVDVESGIFPWRSSSSKNGGTLADIDKRLLVEANSKMTRCIEELELIRQDMDSYLKYYTANCTELKHEIDSIEVFPPDDTEEKMKLSWRASLLRKGLSFSTIQLEEGIQQFSSILSPCIATPDVCFTEDVHISDSGDEIEQVDLEDEMTMADLTVDSLRDIGVEYQMFSTDDCIFVQNGSCYSVTLPAGYSQSELNGRNGSSACTVISLVTGYFFNSKRIVFNQPNIFANIIPIYLGCIDLGNSIHDRPELLSVPEALSLLGDFSMDLFSESNCTFDALPGQLDAISNSQFSVVIFDSKSLCILKDGENIMLFDSHRQSNESGALIMQCSCDNFKCITGKISQNPVSHGICINILNIIV